MRADARRGEIERRRRAEPAGADAEHARGLQLALPLDADLRHDQMPAVALNFVVRQLRQRVRRVAQRPPATDGTMLSVSAAADGRASVRRYRMSSSLT